MAKTTDQKTTERDVVALIGNVKDDDPLSFHALMDTWSRIFDVESNDTVGQFAHVEGAAIRSLMSEHDGAPSAEVGKRVGKMLDQFAHATFLVKENGAVAAQNTAAFQTFGLKPDDKIDNLPFALEEDQPISRLVQSSLDSQRNEHDAQLKHAFSTVDDSRVTLAVTPSKVDAQGQGEALLFLINTSWSSNAAELIQREFSLSNAERELLLSFLGGLSTQDIAEHRGRSHATVRTQMYSLMTKMGARTQTELLRNALSVSQFVDQVDDIAHILRYPHRKRVDVLRPGGRSVEVSLEGDLTGRPVVILHSLTNYTNPPHVGRAFYEQGLLAVCICRPGFGDTSPAPSEDAYFETAVADIGAVLDQLGHDTAALVGFSTSPPLSYRFAAAMPYRLTHIIQIAGTVPLPCALKGSAASPWAKGLIGAAAGHPSLLEFMARAGVRAWKALGTERFMYLQFKGNPEELEAVKDPLSAAEFEAALRLSTDNGTRRAAKELFTSFTDYSADVERCAQPTLALHGARDGSFSIDAVRAFQEAYPGKVSLVSFDDGFGPIICTHTDEVISQIKKFIASSPESLPYTTSV